MHNLGTVIRFEIKRTLKKKSFWIMSLGFPVMAAAIFGIIFFSNKATDSAADKMSKEKFSLQVTDESGLISKQLLSGIGAKSVASKQEGIDNVKNGKVDAYFYYPEKIDKQSVEVYGKDVGMFDNSRYSSVAKLLLSQSVGSEVSSAVTSILKDKVSFESTAYRDGEKYDGFKQMIAPGIFLVLFYLLIAFFGNQMLNSTTEEKENRVVEMILTTIKGKTLIIGKILSLIVLGFTQMIIILLPIALGYILLHDKLSLPSFDLSNLPLDPVRIGVSFVIFSVSFMLFTGLLVAIGAATPTAKEAGQFFGLVMMLIFGPLYAAPLFISSPDSPIVHVLSLFPLTAPIPLMLRNAVGNLPLWEAGLGIAILAITTTIVMAIAIRVFRYGALEYSRKLGLKDIF